jgi:hypothetical protein
VSSSCVFAVLFGLRKPEVWPFWAGVIVDPTYKTPRNDGWMEQTSRNDKRTTDQPTNQPTNQTNTHANTMSMKRLRWSDDLPSPATPPRLVPPPPPPPPPPLLMNFTVQVVNVPPCGHLDACDVCYDSLSVSSMNLFMCPDHICPRCADDCGERLVCILFRTTPQFRRHMHTQGRAAAQALIDETRQRLVAEAEADILSLLETAMSVSVSQLAANAATAARASFGVEYEQEQGSDDDGGGLVESCL